MNREKGKAKDPENESTNTIYRKLAKLISLDQIWKHDKRIFLLQTPYPLLLDQRCVLLIGYTVMCTRTPKKVTLKFMSVYHFFPEGYYYFSFREAFQMPFSTVSGKIHYENLLPLFPLPSLPASTPFSVPTSISYYEVQYIILYWIKANVLYG